VRRKFVKQINKKISVRQKPAGFELFYKRRLKNNNSSVILIIIKRTSYCCMLFHKTSEVNTVVG